MSTLDVFHRFWPILCSLVWRITTFLMLIYSRCVRSYVVPLGLLKFDYLQVGGGFVKSHSAIASRWLRESRALLYLQIISDTEAAKTSCAGYLANIFLSFLYSLLNIGWRSDLYKPTLICLCVILDLGSQIIIVFFVFPFTFCRRNVDSLAAWYHCFGNRNDLRTADNFCPRADSLYLRHAYL